MGSKKYWGVYMYIGNFPQELRLSRNKKGGVVLLGHIPEVRDAVLGHVDDLGTIHRCLENQRTQTQLSPITVLGFTMQLY